MSARTVESLAVVLVLTEDTGRLAAFYRDVLGLDLAEEEHDGRHLHYACRLGSVYFTIQCNGDLRGQEPGFPAQAIGDSNTQQLCFSVQDMDAFLRHLRDRQVEPLHPVRPFEHTTFTTLRDPDGRLVRVMTPGAGNEATSQRFFTMNPHDVCSVAELLTHVQGQVSRRKLLLLVFAYARRCWHELPEETRRVIETAESVLTGHIRWPASVDWNDLARESISLLNNWAEGAAHSYLWNEPTDWASDPVLGTIDTLSVMLRAFLIPEAEIRVGPENLTTGHWYPYNWENAVYNMITDLSPKEDAVQAALTREVVGNLLRGVEINPSWLAWNGGAVVKMARAILDQGNWSELPVLADALEDVGCENAVVLEHCRGQHSHVPGCWLVDALLGLN